MHTPFHHSSAGSVQRVRDSFKHRLSENPYLHWISILIVWLVLSLGFTGIGYMKYTAAFEQLSAPPAVTGDDASKVFDPDDLAETIERFSDRAIQRATLQKGYTGVGDPAL